MGTEIKILIAEHDPHDLELLQYQLKKDGINYISEVVQNEPDYVNAIKKFVPDIILSDYSFPSFDGLTAFKIRGMMTQDTPFILVSGTIGEEKAVELIKNGVTDYVLKDKMYSLAPKIRRALKEEREKQLKNKIEQEREFDRTNLNALINNTNDLMWSVDRDFKLITSNQPFDEITRLTGKAIETGSSILSGSVSDEQSNRFKMCYERAFTGERFVETEYNEKPVEHWMEISYCPIRKDNEIIGAACHSRNITERKIAEEELISNNIELLKTNAELDRFVYSTSHDLRSPLTSILGLLYFIEAESKEVETLVYAKMIRASIERLDGFIKNILYYSRNNRTELELIHIPLQKTLDEIVNSLHNMEEAEHINFEVNIDELHPFYSDGQRFNAIIENLISNAIKYQSQDRTERYVKVSGWSDIDYLHIQIDDNGIGIAHKFQNKIFDMFFRIPSKKAGTGIGLYIVKETVDKLEGTIRVDSEEGSGTKFTLKLKNLIR